MSSVDGISWGTRIKKECEERLRALVPPGEEIIAGGTVEQLSSIGAEIGSGAGWTFLVVTGERILFERFGMARKPHEEIRIADISSWASGTQYNCYAVVLQHPQMTRRERVPAKKFLWFQWDNAGADVTRIETIFRFSRPETKAAKALRETLEAQRVPHERLHLEHRSREERTRGSHVVLTPKRLE